MVIIRRTTRREIKETYIFSFLESVEVPTRCNLVIEFIIPKFIDLSRLLVLIKS